MFSRHHFGNKMFSRKEDHVGWGNLVEMDNISIFLIINSAVCVVRLGFGVEEGEQVVNNVGFVVVVHWFLIVSLSCCMDRDHPDLEFPSPVGTFQESTI